MSSKKGIFLTPLQYNVLLKIKEQHGILEASNGRFHTIDRAEDIHRRTALKLMETPLVEYITDVETHVTYEGSKYLATHKVATLKTGGKKVIKLEGEQLQVSLAGEKKIDMELIEGVISNIVDVVEERIWRRQIVKELDALNKGPQPPVEINPVEEKKDENPAEGEKDQGSEKEQSSGAEGGVPGRTRIDMGDKK